MRSASNIRAAVQPMWDAYSLKRAFLCLAIAASVAACGGGSSSANTPSTSASIQAIARVPKYNPATGNSVSVQVALSPAQLGAGKYVELELITLAGAGAAVFDGPTPQGTTLLRITGSTTVAVRGIANSDRPQNVELSARDEAGAQLGKIRFSVRTWPVNFRRVTPDACDSGPEEILRFDYTWDSESGDPNDLDGNLFGEYVEYPAERTRIVLPDLLPVFVYPNPPYQTGSLDYTVANPYVRWLEMSATQRDKDRYMFNDKFFDKHEHPAFAQCVQADVFVATQRYFFRDPVLMPAFDVSNPATFLHLPGMGPFFIRRNVFELGGQWLYQVEKDQCSKRFAVARPACSPSCASIAGTWTSVHSFAVTACTGSSTGTEYSGTDLVTVRTAYQYGCTVLFSPPLDVRGDITVMGNSLRYYGVWGQPGPGVVWTADGFDYVGTISSDGRRIDEVGTGEISATVRGVPGSCLVSSKGVWTR